MTIRVIKPDPTFSHHKITNFEFADADDLTLYYDKIGDAYENMVIDINVDGAIQETDLENRIGVLSLTKRSSSRSLLRRWVATQLKSGSKQKHLTVTSWVSLLLLTILD